MFPAAMIHGAVRVCSKCRYVLCCARHSRSLVFRGQTNLLAVIIHNFTKWAGLGAWHCGSGLLW